MSTKISIAGDLGTVPSDLVGAFSSFLYMYDEDIIDIEYLIDEIIGHFGINKWKLMYVKNKLNRMEVCFQRKYYNEDYKVRKLNFYVTTSAKYIKRAYVFELYEERMQVYKRLRRKAGGDLYRALPKFFNDDLMQFQRRNEYDI